MRYFREILIAFSLVFLAQPATAGKKKSNRIAKVSGKKAKSGKKSTVVSRFA